MSVNLRRALVVGTTTLAIGGGIAVTPASAHRLTQTRAASVALDVARNGADRFESLRIASCQRRTVHRFRCIAQYFHADDDGQLSADSYISVAYRSSTSRRFRTSETQFECYTEACRSGE